MGRPSAAGPHTDLPLPTAAAAAHARRLRRLVDAEITAAAGAIDFRRYMELVLYAPGLGYYSAGARKFGAAGDFMTAPEMGPLFARCLARQCRQILEQTGGGVILEVGAGSGVMAADLLLELECLGSLPDRYLVLEVSADLRQRQRALLEACIPVLLDRVHWLDTLPVEPINGVIVANEVLDALPVHRIATDGDRVHGLGVERVDDGYRWCELPLHTDVQSRCGELLALLPGRYPHGCRTEVSLDVAPWVASFGALLGRGAILVCDYGYPRREYYHEQRLDGTLRCQYRHRVHGDPFLYPGLQDISAAVDFTAVAGAAVGAGLAVAGFTTQAHFLLGCDIEAVAAPLLQGDTRQRVSVSRQIQLLTLPAGMGEMVKVMALGRGLSGPLCGFGFRDQKQRLQ